MKVSSKQKAALLTVLTACRHRDMVKTERKWFFKKKKKKQCIHNFTNEICSKYLNPFSPKEISKGMGQAVPCVYTDRYQVLPNHLMVTAAPITQNRD